MGGSWTRASMVVAEPRLAPEKIQLRRGKGAGLTLIGYRVTGVRVTPISGRFVGSVRRGPTLTGGALSVDSVGLGLSVGLGGTIATAGGVVSGAADGGVMAVVSTVFAGPRELREISRTTDTSIAIPAIPIAPMATIAAVVRYQGTGGCRLYRSPR